MLIALRDGEFPGNQLALSFEELRSLNEIMLLNFEIIKDILQGCLYCVSFELRRLEPVYLSTMAAPRLTSR
jgi:hypothetical protein